MNNIVSVDLSQKHNVYCHFAVNSQADAEALMDLIGDTWLNAPFEIALKLLHSEQNKGE